MRVCFLKVDDAMMHDPMWIWTMAALLLVIFFVVVVARLMK
jgi:hypothetical protein